MTIPKILIIDDQYGGVHSGDHQNRERAGLCYAVGLQDRTGDVKAETIKDPVAEAVFCRGQILENGRVLNDLNGTMEVIRRGWRVWPRWALLLLDMQFRTGPVGTDGEPKGQATNGHPESYFGMTILDQLWRDPSLRDIPVVILSSMKREQIERRFTNRGVFDFMDKTDLTSERLQQLLLRYGLLESDAVFGRSVAFLKCLREARQRAALGNDNILLIGETGTGKELLSRYIHDHSPWCEGPFCTVSLQNVPDTQVDDLIFGHKKGAFTDAKFNQMGAAEAADHGSLFIDEFGDIPASIQPKLLRLLDKNVRESRRIGASPTDVKKLDLQVVLATERLDIMKAKDFRKALLFRVSIGDAIRVPSLRERQEDIPLLVEHFLHKYEQRHKSTLHTNHRTVADEAMADLCKTDWQGNVRELESAIERVVRVYPGLRVLSVEHLRISAVSIASKIDAPIAELVASEPSAELPGKSLTELLSQLKALDLSSAPEHRPAWAGKLPELQTAFAHAAAALLKAALTATSKPTTEKLEGEINIHPAVKLAMGDKNLTASTAADIIKRVLSLDPVVQKQLFSDRMLKEAYEIAIRLRPKKPKIAKKEYEKRSLILTNSEEDS